ncbi:indole-3-glycerol phosphate synthase TrpC [Gallibacter sp. Marseille-QA0791]|uniref:indole-3-glycerol phosphate synthase TrpC n=1 Tax=Gallibacter sp. Marseille-QA0791 TaxID=3378781 RepID=UPI003D0F7E8C
MGERNILDEIAARTRQRVAEAKIGKPLAVVRAEAEEVCRRQSGTAGGGASFIAALRAKGMSYICEIKKASPSKGVIACDFPYMDIAREYEEAGAAAISCLTEPFYFRGSDRYLAEIAAAVDIPVLRKDFVVSDYMIYEARMLGASAVLLICSLLDDGELKEYLALARALGMEALVEAHDEEEIGRAVKAGAGIIGVNNRDLKTFRVDMTNSIRLKGIAPEDTVFVSESGIRTADDIARLRASRIDAVLIGETLMRSGDRKKMLEQLNGGGLR